MSALLWAVRVVYLPQAPRATLGSGSMGGGAAATPRAPTAASATEWYIDGQHTRYVRGLDSRNCDAQLQKGVRTTEKRGVGAYANPAPTAGAADFCTTHGTDAGLSHAKVIDGQVRWAGPFSV